MQRAAWTDMYRPQVYKPRYAETQTFQRDYKAEREYSTQIVNQIVENVFDENYMAIPEACLQGCSNNCPWLDKTRFQIPQIPIESNQSFFTESHPIISPSPSQVRYYHQSNAPTQTTPLGQYVSNVPSPIYANDSNYSVKTIKYCSIKQECTTISTQSELNITFNKKKYVN